jgi:hypothetical protein
MLGPEGAVEALATLLANELPAKAGELTTRLNTARLPRVEREALIPKLIEPYEVLDLPVDAFPAFLVVAQGMTRMVRVDIAGAGAARYAGQAVYRVRYRLRVFTWARGRTGTADPAERAAEADRNRKRLVLAVREVLLSGQELNVVIGRTVDLDPDDDGYRAGEEVTGAIDETTLTESYDAIAVDEQSSTVAAAYTEVEVELDEAIPLVEPARLAELVDLSALPHPADL